MHDDKCSTNHFVLSIRSKFNDFALFSFPIKDSFQDVSVFLITDWESHS